MVDVSNNQPNSAPVSTANPAPAAPNQAAIANNTAEAIDLIKAATSILIFLPRNADVDMVAAALGLILSLEKAGKKVQCGCETPMTVAFNRLFGIDRIKTKIGSRNLIISFPYVEESIEKVSSHVAENRFNLVIVPKTGMPPLDPEKVTYGGSGLEGDLIINIGVPKLDDLGHFYQEDRDFFEKTKIINLDLNPTMDTRYGAINIVEEQTLSYAEIAARWLRQGEFPIGDDIATNLLAGIEAITNYLQIRTTPDTIDLAAWLLKNGGKRWQLAAGGNEAAAAASGLTQQQLLALQQQQQQAAMAAAMMGGNPAASGLTPQQLLALQQQQQQAAMAQAMMAQQAQMQAQVQAQAAAGANPANVMSGVLSSVQPGMVNPAPVAQPMMANPTPNLNNQPAVVMGQAAPAPASQPPADWLTPKIYKGNQPGNV